MIDYLKTMPIVTIHVATLGIVVFLNVYPSVERKFFGRRDVVESFRFHPTLILFYLKECQFCNKL